MEVFDGICDPARDAIAQDITTIENRQAAFSLMYLAHNLGYIIGPIIAGILFFRAIRWIFWGTGIASALSLLVLMLFIPESKPDKTAIEKSRQSSGTDKAEDGGLLKALASRKRLLVFAASMMFVSTAYRQVLFGLPLLLVRRFGEIGSTLFGTVNSLNGLVCVLATAPVVALLHRRHPLRNVMLGGLFYIAGFSFLGLMPKAWMFFGCAIIYTLGEVIESTSSRFYVANNTPITHRARFQSVLPVIMYSGSAFGPLSAGLISDGIGLQWLWPISGILVLIGIAGTWSVYRLDRKEENEVQPDPVRP